ncbi:hypothetical protein D6777_00980 [Candidatus Woesearchaeota archaeon]|nr:MAG: hypothetical protein D6777_00980 [Candidatus Woesearchaeota archaeon]
MTDNNRLLKAIEAKLHELLVLFKEGKISEDDLIEEINSSVHYSVQDTFMAEMLFVVALEHNLVPQSGLLISKLFNSDVEDFVYPDNVSGPYKRNDSFEYDYMGGTRLKVLKSSGLGKSLELYKKFLISINEEVRKEAGFKPVSLQQVRQAVLKETNVIEE